MIRSKRASQNGRLSMSVITNREGFLPKFDRDRSTIAAEESVRQSVDPLASLGQLSSQKAAVPQPISKITIAWSKGMNRPTQE